MTTWTTSTTATATPSTEVTTTSTESAHASGAGTGPEPRTSPVVELDAVSDLFRCLSSPVRVAVIRELTAGERCVHELVEALALPQPLVSQHLRVLRDADLVNRVRRGREVAYELADDHVAHIVEDALVHTREGQEPHR